ncbi:MAG TPA: hypothetical protein VFY84_06360 [Jiangellales bacterium]|nr:hypothetical protein [Jiangellales bacterium]
MTQQRRTIHPGDAQDERLAEVPLTAAYTYAYLATVLDDAGRAKDQPAVLNGYLWPLRADEHGTEAMAADLDALESAGLICRYVVDERAYLHDPAWRARQRIARPEPSALPPCPTHDTAVDDVVGETLRRLTDQISSFVGSAAASFDETKIRDAVSRAVEDVTFMIDPEKAASFGQRVREFFGETTGSARPPRVEDDVDLADGDVWHEVTDRPNGSREH